MLDELKEEAIRALIGLVVLTWGVVLWRLQRDPAMPNFTFRNLLATKDGYPDRVAIEELGAFAFMSAVIVISALRKAELVALCSIYVGAFVLRGAHAAYLKANHPALELGSILPPGKGSIVETETSLSKSSTKETKL